MWFDLQFSPLLFFHHAPPSHSAIPDFRTSVAIYGDRRLIIWGTLFYFYTNTNPNVGFTFQLRAANSILFPRDAYLCLLKVKNMKIAQVTLCFQVAVARLWLWSQVVSKVAPLLRVTSRSGGGAAQSKSLAEGASKPVELNLVFPGWTRTQPPIPPMGFQWGLGEPLSSPALPLGLPPWEAPSLWFAACWKPCCLFSGPWRLASLFQSKQKGFGSQAPGVWKATYWCFVIMKWSNFLKTEHWAPA